MIALDLFWQQKAKFYGYMVLCLPKFYLESQVKINENNYLNGRESYLLMLDNSKGLASWNQRSYLLLFMEIKIKEFERNKSQKLGWPKFFS